MRHPTITLSIVGWISLAAPLFAQHAGDIWIGRSAAGQLKIDTLHGFDPSAGPIVLPATGSGSLFNGWSDNDPGFDALVASYPSDDLYPLASGAQIRLEITAIDPALLVVVPPSLIILDSPGQVTTLGDHTLHKHLIWLIDADDPNFDNSRCYWQATFVLKDTGSTGYTQSAPFTLRFTRTVHIPGDFDCDADVDLDDVNLWTPCVSGPAVPYNAQNPPAGCALTNDGYGRIDADLDRDGDVDQTDFGILQRCYSGPGIPGDPTCAD